MAKKDKAKDKADTKAKDKGSKAKADKTEKAPKEKAAEFKYGVSDVAEALGIKEASVRVQLRNKDVPKAGKSYGWNTQAELKEVIAKLKTADESKEKKAKGDKKSDKADAGKGDKKKDKKKKSKD